MQLEKRWNYTTILRLNPANEIICKQNNCD